MEGGVQLASANLYNKNLTAKVLFGAKLGEKSGHFQLDFKTIILCYLLISNLFEFHFLKLYVRNELSKSIR